MLRAVRQHVVVKTILAIFACVAVVSVLSIVYFNSRFRQQLQEEFAAKLDSTRQLIEGSYRQPLWNVQRELIRTLNEAVLSAPAYRAIVIYDVDRRGLRQIHLATRKVVTRQRVRFVHSRTPPAEPEDGMLRGAIYNEQHVIGEYELHYTLEPIDAHVRTNLVNLILSFVLISAVIAASLLVLLNRSVIRKLFSIVQFAKSVAAGEDYSRRISLESGDEIGVLAGSINDMLAQIERRDREKDAVSRELSRSQSYLQGVFDAISGTLLVLEPETGRIRDANRALERMFRATREQVIGEDIGWLSPGDPPYDAPTFLEWLAKAEAQGPQTFPWLCRRRDGGPFWAELDVSHCRMGAESRFIVLISDISRRRDAEIALRESEARFKALHNASFGGIIIHDKGIILDCNHGLTAITGYAMDELIGMNGLLLIAESSRGLVLDHILAQYEKPYEAVGLRKNGEEYPVRLEGRMIPYRGREVRVVEFRDITEQKQAEQALKHSEHRFKTLVENSGDITEVIDAQGRASYVSPQVETILGYTTEEILAMESVFERVHPDDLPAMLATIQVCLPVPESKGRAEYRYRHKDGRWIWLEATGSNLLHNPFVRGLFLIIQDITARKQAEAALRESEEKLRTLFASMTEMVVLYEIVWDGLGQPVNYRITDCNQAFCLGVGIAREDLVGRLATEVYATPVPPYLEEYAGVAATGTPHHFEAFFPLANRHLAVSVVSPARGRFATISTDITDAKKYQQVIAAKNKELEQLVYVASHDLRSPLVNVDGYGKELEYTVQEIVQVLDGPEAAVRLESLLRERLPDLSVALRHIRGSTRQMEALLKGLLKLSRLGRAALSIRALDMNRLVAQVVSNLQYQIREAGAEVRIGELPPCQGDEVQVAQVFANLLGNALKFRDPARPLVVTMDGVMDHGRCVYGIQDNGIGIPLEHRERIFELFARLDPEKTEGEGLGLTIVRQILGRLEGDIRVESVPGQGSRFLVVLPMERAAT